MSIVKMINSKIILSNKVRIKSFVASFSEKPEVCSTYILAPNLHKIKPGGVNLKKILEEENSVLLAYKNRDNSYSIEVALFKDKNKKDIFLFWEFIPALHFSKDYCKNHVVWETDFVEEKLLIN